jgi:hypothetical protein
MLDRRVGKPEIGAIHWPNSVDDRYDLEEMTLNWFEGCGFVFSGDVIHAAVARVSSELGSYRDAAFRRSGLQRVHQEVRNDARQPPFVGSGDDRFSGARRLSAPCRYRWGTPVESSPARPAKCAPSRFATCRLRAFGQPRPPRPDKGLGATNVRTAFLGGFYAGDGTLFDDLALELKTGPGLAISQRLVHAMQGTIGVTSILDEGSTFWFTALFPLKSASRLSSLRTHWTIHEGIVEQLHQRAFATDPLKNVGRQQAAPFSHIRPNRQAV